MAIKRVEIKDFLVFNGEFSADFCPGVNVLIGGNGTGKTTLLKVLHWACEFADFQLTTIDGVPTALLIPHHMNSYFHKRDLNSSSSDIDQRHLSTIRVIRFDVDGETPALAARISESLDSLFHKNNPESNLALDLWCDHSLPSVFIPTAEMLSHSRGLLALSRERQIPFDKTELDIIAKAELEPTHELTKNALAVLDKITRAIGGIVSHDGKDFYIEKESGQKIHFSFEASGYRKLGLLWRLLRNGLLEPGSVLFWDEPENSLNPELVPILVDILLELSRNGVQIFIATHSEILSAYFAVNRQKDDAVMFTSLYTEGEQIKATTNERFDLLEPNNLTAEPVKLYEKQIVRGLGGDA